MIKAKYQKMYTEEFMKDMDFIILGDYYIGPFIDRKRAELAADNINNLYNQLPSKPRTKEVYEKVTESIFNLKEDFKNGKLFTKKFNQEWHQIKSEVQLGGLLSMNDDPTKNGIYRKVEKEIDWRDEVSDFVINNNIIYSCNGNKHIIALAEYTDEQFLEMCRVALRATGELNNG